MKRLLIFMAMLLVGVLTFAQETITVSANSEDISQGLDLKMVAKLFAEASTTEQFEVMLNNPDSAYSNLDLNGDGDIDYLRVVEAGTADNRIIIIQAVLAPDIYQDVASIYLERSERTNKVFVQVIGDEYIYGTNYIIEPVYIYRPIIYTWLWSPHWHCWQSPYYWGYYPHWWYHRHCYAHHWYWDRCYRFHHHHGGCSYHYNHHPYNGYHAVHRSVSRREYATAHPENSFSRRNTNVINARNINRNARTRIERLVVSRETNPSVRATRPVQRTERTTQPSQRTTQRTERTTVTRSTSTQRTERPVNTNRTTNTQRSQSTRTTNTAPTQRTNGAVQRGGSTPRPSGGSVRSGGSSAPRPSGGSRTRR